MQQVARPPAPSWRPGVFWLAIAAYFLFVAIGSNLLEIRYSYFTQDEAGSWGMSFARQGPDVLVQSVEPGSMAAEQGVAAGDVLHPPDRSTIRLIPLVGEKVTLTRISPLPRKQITIVTAQADPAPMVVPDLADRLIDDAVRIIVLLGGVFILWRGWGRRSNFMLGLGLVGLIPFPYVWLPLGPQAFLAWELALEGVFYSAALILALFAMAYVEEIGVRLPSWAKWAFGAGVIGQILDYSIKVLFAPGSLPEWLYAFADMTNTSLGVATYLLVPIVLWLGWLQGGAKSRHRTVLLLLSVGLVFMANVLFTVFNYITYTQANPRWITDSSSMLRLSGSLLFIYAILRHRVIDVGFTLNRTLVYGAVTFTLLAAFGLMEWGVEHLIPEAWHEGGQFISAALAVGLFLSFHRLREWFEHQIERLFFSSWQKAEAALRRFVESAGHFEQVPALCKGFNDALDKFTQDSGAAIYLRETGGTYRLECGGPEGAPDAYTEDRPDFALMRAERTPIDLAQTGGALPGELALPMLDQGALIGFVLLGPKPDGTHYRPDEVENLGWAAHQVGLDLRALHARQLENQVTLLSEKLAWYESERGKAARAGA